MFTILFAVCLAGWMAAAALGTQAYFRGEQSKPIHSRNWNSESFEQAAQSVTGTNGRSVERVPGFVVGDAYASQGLL